jgi:regulator of RNase E activity RraA
MDKTIERIITYIKRNRVSTTEVADCLNKSGVIPDVAAVNCGQHKVGKVRYIFGFSESNWSVHEQAANAKEDEIVVIDGIEMNGRAIVGELVVKFLILYRGATAIIMLGKARDANGLIKNGYPVWCKGYNPVGSFNTKKTLTPAIETIANRNRAYYDGSIAVCDDTGAVIIPKEQITEKFLSKLEWIEEQEDMWFHCIDRLRWNTFDTVCLEKYKDFDKDE